MDQGVVRQNEGMEREMDLKKDKKKISYLTI